MAGLPRLQRGIEPSIGVFIDGVYRSRFNAQIGDLPRIKRVEVLRGPQSTLFGKNAPAGMISTVTQEPHSIRGGNIEASYGNYDSVTVEGYVTGPVPVAPRFLIAGARLGTAKRDRPARTGMRGSSAT